MTESKNKLEDKFKKWIEWKFYKIIYIGILVPLLIGEAKKWIFQDISIAIVFFITAIILLLPAIFKLSEILGFIDGLDKNE